MHKKINTYCTITLCLLGLLFSGWNAFFKESVFCLTNSCHVVADFAIFDISLWIYSFIFFVLVNALLIMKKESFALILLFFGVIGDMGLLVLMLFTAPCFNCLIIALLLALSFLSMAYSRNYKKLNYALLAIWLLLFVINAGAIAKTILSPYSIYINPAYSEDVYSSSMRIFFSPSCSACKTAVDKLGSEEMTIEADIAWLPVAESSEDIILVLQLKNAIDAGMSLKEAMQLVMQNPQKSSIDTLIPEFIMQIKLLVNQSMLSQRGTTRIPFVEYTGLPAHISSLNTDNLQEQNKEVDMLEILRNMSPEANNLRQENNGNNIGVGAFCDQSNSEPCD